MPSIESAGEVSEEARTLFARQWNLEEPRNRLTNTGNRSLDLLGGFWHAHVGWIGTGLKVMDVVTGEGALTELPKVVVEVGTESNAALLEGIKMESAVQVVV